MAFMDGARGPLRAAGKALHAVVRAAGWAFLVLVLFAAGFGAYVYHRFSPEQARGLAVEQLTALLRRQVAIDRLVLTPRGVKVLGLRVRRGRPGEGADVLSCDSVLVTIKFRPLLQRRVEFDAVLLESPQISLVREADGSWELEDLFASTGSRRGALLPVALAAAETTVLDGTLRLDDRMHGRKVSLEKFYLRTAAFDDLAPFPLETSFTSAISFGTRTYTTRVHASAVVDLAGQNWSSATVRVEEFSASVGDAEFKGRLSLLGFSSPRLEADFASPALPPDRWKRLTGLDSRLNLPAARVRLRAAVPAPGMVDVEKATIDLPAGAVSGTGVIDFGAAPPGLSLELSAENLSLEKLAALDPEWEKHEPSGKASARASVTGWPGRLQARDAELSLRGFGARWGDRRVEGVDLEAAAGDEFSRVKAVATRGKVTLAGNVFDEISFSLNVRNQNLQLERLALRWGGSRARVRARVERLSKPKEVVLSGSVDKIDWDAAARLIADIRSSISTRTAPSGGEGESRPWVRTFKYVIPRSFPDTVGRVRVGELSHANFWSKDLDLLWTLRNVTPALDKVSGEARLAFGPGRVNDIPAVQDANKFLRVIFLPFVFMHKMNNLSAFSTNTAYPKTLDFNRIDGEYGAAKGVATTRYFHVDSGQLVAYAEGTADFARERVDMNILTRLTAYRGTLPEWWVDEAGRPAIGFRVKGDLNHPDLEPRFRKIAEGELERMVEEGRARARKRFEALEKLQTL